VHLSHLNENLKSKILLCEYIYPNAAILLPQSGVGLSHTHREGNMGAHFLARHAQHVFYYIAWMEDTPVEMASQVALDRAPGIS
jgi:hypothetical protein